MTVRTVCRKGRSNLIINARTTARQQPPTPMCRAWCKSLSLPGMMWQPCPMVASADRHSDMGVGVGVDVCWSVTHRGQINQY